MHWTRDALEAASGLELPERARPLPWYGRLLMGIGGWVGALFLLGFGLLFMMSAPGLWVPIGGAVLLSAVFLQRSAFGQGWADDALEQGAFALGLAGRGLVFFGLERALGLRGAAVAMGMVELVLTVAFPTTLHRIASVLALPTLCLVALADAPQPWVVEGLGVITCVVALAALSMRHPLERRAARREARRLWGHRTADQRLLSGLASDVGLGLALWTMGLEVARVFGFGGGLPFGLLYGLLAAAVLSWLAWSHELTWRQRLAAGLGVVALIGVGTQVPGLPLAVAFALVAVRTRHTVLAGLALAFVVADSGLFYYQLSATLAVKGAALVVGGGAVLSLRALAGASAEVGSRERTGWAWRGAMAAALIGTLGLVGARVAASEVQLADAETVYLELGPRDPRSLVQGDYMVLVYRIGGQLRRYEVHDRLIGQLDADGVVRSVRAPEFGTVAADERVLRRPGWLGGGSLATDSFLFQEGHAEAYEQARYGVFALSSGGQLTLVGLADEQRALLGPRRSRW